MEGSYALGLSPVAHDAVMLVAIAALWARVKIEPHAQLDDSGIVCFALRINGPVAEVEVL